MEEEEEAAKIESTDLEGEMALNMLFEILNGSGIWVLLSLCSTATPCSPSISIQSRALHGRAR